MAVDHAGDKLEAGDVLTVILTDRAQDDVITVTKKGAVLKVPLEELIAFSFTVTEEMKEIYIFYELTKRMKKGSSRRKKVQITIYPDFH